jgi:hypothetical protein
LFQIKLKTKNWLIIGITTTILLFFGGISLDKKDIVPKESFDTKIENEVIVEGKALRPYGNSLSVQTQVKDYFKDTPILAKIAWCESRLKHFNEDGSILRGKLTPKDVGMMQINEYYHKKTAKILGINIYSLEGNMAYAKWLYKREGTTPWASSSKCWNKYEEIAMK